MIEYNKLVRDKIPQLIEQQGEKAHIQILDEKEYTKELLKKLNEEVNEYLESQDVEELADILEVIYAICESKTITRDELEKRRLEKFHKRGGFSQRIFLINKEEI
ncbi:MAG: phosphoribosyl-ATP pyrophosphohydrolase [Longibaculum sp.]